jgi:hypothetical protein
MAIDKIPFGGKHKQNLTPGRILRREFDAA